MKKITLLMAAAFALSACGGEAAEQQPRQAETVHAAEKEVAAKTLPLDWETFKKRVDDDFAAADFGFAKIPDSIKPEGDAKAARLTVTLPVNDNLSAIIGQDPASQKLTNISINLIPHSDPAENLKNFSVAAVMMSASAGDEGNRQVGGRIIKMSADAVEKFAAEVKKDDSASVEDKFVENGVKYGILISSVMPIMMYAEPAPDQD